MYTRSRITTTKRNILHYKLLNRRFVFRNRLFFSWVFNVIHLQGLRLDKMQKKSLNSVVKCNKKRGPLINLRLQALQARLSLHGNKTRARVLLENLIILLTENSKSDSGLSILNSVLLKLEPPYEVISRRRGLETFVYPIPIWPSRKRFLAVRLLVAGARQSQKEDRGNFLHALFSEVEGVYLKKPDTFTGKLYKRILRLGVKNMHVAGRFTKNTII